MKRSYKSGAQKRKEAASAKKSEEKLTKLTRFFGTAQDSTNPCKNAPDVATAQHEQTSMAASAIMDNLDNAETEKDPPSSDLFPANVEINNESTVVATETSDFTPQPPFNPLSNDPAYWPEYISDAQRCDIVKRGPQQLDIAFPVNAARRRFSTFHYKRVMNNGEIVPRSWLIYSREVDKVFCFCCKLFSTSKSPFCTGSNTWEGIAKKLKEHENGASHKKYFSDWIMLREGICCHSTVDKQEMEIFLSERTFRRKVLERLIDIVTFLAERNLAFRGSDEVLGSPRNGNFLGLLELLAKRDPVLIELKNRIITHKTKDHYLSNKIQNELIDILAKNVEKELIKQLHQAKYYAISLDCTPDISHKEQMTLILRYVECNEEAGVVVKEAFLGYLKVDDSTGKGLLETFMKRAEELGLILADCRGQCYDNGANMKGKEAGVQARLLELNSKALYVPCANHSLNLVVVDSAKSSTEALLFFGLLAQLYILFSASTQRWAILKKHVQLSIKSLSATRWESRINCIVPLRFYLPDVLDALEELQHHSIQKRDGKTANEVQSLIDAVSSWKFILSLVIWHDILFQVNKASKLMQTCGISIDVVKTEIHATQSFLKNYRQSGYSSAVTSAREIAEDLGVESVFVQKRKRKKKRIFDYESKEQCTEASKESECLFKTNFFLQLVDRAIASLKDRFEQMHSVAEIFNFLFSQESLLKACDDNTLLDECISFNNTMGDIDPFELKDELKRFVNVIKTHRDSLKTTRDFLDYICKKGLLEVYPNLFIALRVAMTCPISVASAERSFSTLKLIKTFHRSTILDDRLSSLAILSVENACVRSLDYNGIIDAFATAKARKKNF